VSTVRVRDVLRGVAAHLAASGIGYWSETEPAPTGATLIALKRLPDSPDRAVAVSVYGMDLDAVLPDVELPVQVLARSPGVVDDVDDLADDVVTAMHGVHHATWGALRVQRCVHTSTAPLGADRNGREERSDNFLITTLRPTGGTP
jgi:hypothetical protein